MRVGRVAVWFVVAGCGGESETDRDRLYRLVSGGAVQEAHGCDAVRAAEQSTWRGETPLVAWQLLRERIDGTEIEAVSRCLAEVRAYNVCFEELACEAFEERAQPAWLLGVNHAPCGCGVVAYAPDPGPFVSRRGTLPENLASCDEVLPLDGLLPPVAGFTCP